MGEVLDLLAKRRRERAGLPPASSLDVASAAQASQGGLLSLLEAPVSAVADVGSGLLNTLVGLGDVTRATIGDVTGATMPGGTLAAFKRFPGIGSYVPETGARPPSGRELIGLGSGTPGTFETGDIPGFVVEALASPDVLLGVGSLTRAGKAARDISKATTRLEALRSIGTRAADVTVAEKDLADLIAKTAKRGLPTGPLESTLRRQAEAPVAQRSLVSFAGQPLIRGAPVLGKIGEGAAAVARAVEPIAAPFRASGRVGAATVGSKADAELFNALVDETRGIRRADVLDSGETVGELGAGLEQRRIREAMDKITAGKSQLDAVKAAADATAAGELSRLVGMGIRPTTKKFAKLTEKLNLATIGDPKNELLRLAIEKGPEVQTQIGSTIADIQAKAAERAALTTDPRRLRRIALAAERRAAPWEAQARVADAVWRAMPPEVQNLARGIGQFSDAELAGLKQAGAVAPELGDPALGYLHRQITPMGRKWVDSLQGPSEMRPLAKLFGTAEDFTARRTPQLEGLTHGQIETRANVAGFAKFAAEHGDPGATFMVRDVADTVLDRLTSGARLRANATFLSAIAKNFATQGGKETGVPIAEWLVKNGITRIGADIAGLGQSEGLIKKALRGTGYENAVIPHAIDKAAGQVFKTIQNPSTAEQFMRFLDRINSRVRFGVTQPFPGFHVRNLIGNMFMAFLVGMRDPRWLADGIALARRVSKGTASAADMELWTRATRFGALGQGLTRETIEGMGQAGRLGRAIDRLPVVGSKSRWGQATTRFGAELEDGSKAGLFMFLKSKGLSDAEAGRKVIEYLFDYSDLSPADMAVRRMMFFWTYTRKAIPLLLKEAVNQPATFRGLQTLFGERTGSPQAEFLPDYQRQRGQIAFGKDSAGRQVFRTLDLPVSQLFAFSTDGRGAGRAIQKLAGSAAPTYQALAQLAAFPTSLRSGQPIQGTPLQVVPSTLPTARLTGLYQQISQAAGGQREPGDLLLSLAGLPSTTRVEPDKAKRAIKLQELGKALDREASRGAAQRRLIYTPAKDTSEDSKRRVRRLLELQRRS